MVAAPDAAILFVINLDYQPSPEKTFAWKQPRRMEDKFELPEWLREAVDCFAVSADGIAPARWEKAPGGVKVSATVDKVAVWVVTTNPKLRAALSERHRHLLAEEAAIGFDPVRNDDDFARLVADLGYKGK